MSPPFPQPLFRLILNGISYSSDSESSSILSLGPRSTRDHLESLEFSAEEASFLAGALEDFYLSEDEQLELLTRLDLSDQGYVSSDTDVGQLVRELAGTDGFQPLRHYLWSRSRNSNIAMQISPEILSQGLNLLPGLRQYLRIPLSTVIGQPYRVAWGSEAQMERQIAESLLEYAQGVPKDGSRLTPYGLISRVDELSILVEAGSLAAGEILSEIISLEETSSGEGWDQSTRANALGYLASQGNEQAIRALTNLLSDPNQEFELRLAAVHGYIGGVRDQSESPAGVSLWQILRAEVENHRTPQVHRIAFLNAIARAEPTVEVLAWMEGLVDDPSLAHRGTFRALRPAPSAETISNGSEAADQSLGWLLGIDGAISPLVHSFFLSLDWSLRIDGAISPIYSSRSRGRESETEGQPYRQSYFHHAALAAMGMMDRPEAGMTLLRLVNRPDLDPRLRHQALLAWMNHGGPVPEEDFRAALASLLPPDSSQMEALENSSRDTGLIFRWWENGSEVSRTAERRRARSGSENNSIRISHRSSYFAVSMRRNAADEVEVYAVTIHASQLPPSLLETPVESPSNLPDNLRFNMEPGNPTERIYRLGLGSGWGFGLGSGF